MQYVPQTSTLRGARRKRETPPVLGTLILGLCLAVPGCFYPVGRIYAFHLDQPVRDWSSPSTASQPKPHNASGKRPVTVADSIQMTRLGDQSYADGEPSKGIVAKFSPDGKRFVVILKRGNLEANTNEYSLVLFQTASMFHAAEPQVLVSMASSSNRPGISDVHWLEDNDTILFLGEHPGEMTQVYSLKCNSKELTRLTSSATYLTSLASSANGKVIVFTAKDPAVSLLTDSASRNGILVTGGEVTDLIRGSHGGAEGYDDSLFVKRVGKEGMTKVAAQGRTWALPMALSPDGAYLLVQTERERVPSGWSEYQDREIQMLMRHPALPGDFTTIYQYELVDTATGTSQVLFDAPIASNGSEMAWSSDSKSLVVSDVYLPLNVDDPTERALRKSHTFLVEFEIPSRRFVKISNEDLRLLSWEPKTGYVVCDVGRLESFTGKITSQVYFQKSGEAWSRASSGEQSNPRSLPDIVLVEGMNTPPHIIAVDSITGRKFLLMDLNPNIKNLALAHVEEIRWNDAHRNEVKGGLYWPLDYVAGRKYPLIVQTHGWYSDRFWMDGPYPTGFAAQALASKGFFVLQLPDPDPKIWFTSEEAPRVMAAVESAIDHLDSRGLIDPNRVGLTGFSRTDWYVTFTLTHSKYHFAAAAIADGQDYSYFQYMLYSNLGEGIGGGFERVYGGPPYGNSMAQWLQQSPAFLMDKIETPLRIQALGTWSLLGDWHWYSGLSRLGKPVEMIYIPDGTHVLEKPWDRMVSQQGNVDWFCFWIKGEEDPNPAKAEAYKRWREQRRIEGLKPASNVIEHATD